MHAFDRQTDGRTDGQTDRRTDRRTEISSLRPRCIPCSAVKKTLNSATKKSILVGCHPLQGVNRGVPPRVPSQWCRWTWMTLMLKSCNVSCCSCWWCQTQTTITCSVRKNATSFSFCCFAICASAVQSASMKTPSSRISMPPRPFTKILLGSYFSTLEYCKYRLKWVKWGGEMPVFFPHYTFPYISLRVTIPFSFHSFFSISSFFFSCFDLSWPRGLRSAVSSSVRSEEWFCCILHVKIC